MEGWIKLYRKFLEWEWSDIPEMVSLFIHLILLANTSSGEWHGLPYTKGQLITSVGSLSKKTGLSTQQVRTCLNRLKSTNEITIKSTNKNTIITICKYESYQINTNEDNKQNNEQTNNQITNNQQTNNKQITTDKEYKKVKNKDIINPPTPLKRFGKIDFIDEGFVAVVEKWLGYKKAEFKDEFKTIDSLKMWYNKLYKMAGGDSVVAEMIVNQSIENHWKGIFEVKGSGLPVGISINTGNNGKISPKEALHRMMEKMHNDITTIEL